jgi:hypothetical protein
MDNIEAIGSITLLAFGAIGICLLFYSIYKDRKKDRQIKKVADGFDLDNPITHQALMDYGFKDIGTKDGPAYFLQTEGMYLEKTGPGQWEAYTHKRATLREIQTIGELMKFCKDYDINIIKQL